jgi:hypothetical protein
MGKLTFIDSFPTEKQARKMAAEWKRMWKHGDTVIKKEKVTSLFNRPKWVYTLYQK